MSKRVHLPLVNIKLAGPESASAEDGLAAAQALANAVNAVGRVLSGEQELGAQVAAVYRLCDGCGMRATDAELPEGWSSDTDGNDYCPACGIEADQLEGTRNPRSEVEK